ncbi:NADH-quinone oxidoreductase subunit K [Aquihabitans sp. G128]|uniref:sodium:proton antiporter n=1 Tax=Aquihabitans sp. G128 TaxID=2849779 RepID=UPI001C212F14|nr:NADH-quinone oxidoreductase subunit K [Aquihabitans sp. G128]QXC59170.1 NADH-quinone oxidoreductase subunit K [Aquihabitans sp. G128]
MSVLLAATAAALFGIGTYLVLQRKLSRVIVGVGLMGHGANVLLITAGRRGRSPIIGSSDPSGFADPVPQALALTAIVISFGVTALLLALAYRSWLLTHDDEIADDAEDREVARHGHRDAELVDAAAVEPVDPEGDPTPGEGTP